jgi:hypothetical protein
LAAELGLLLGLVFGVVQPFEKEQVGKLLDGVHGVRKAARLELVPQLINLRAHFGIGEHLDTSIDRYNQHA